MNYSEAIQFLYSLQLFGIKLGLENPRKLAALAGNPQERLRFIHVAGTNGKGSTCAMLESIYRAAGLRVGLFTSPHLIHFGERIQVNRQFIPESDVARLVEEMQPWLAQFPASEHPTFFEVVTIMALRYFAAQQCDLVVWETGMGGRLDATNIVTPLASIITNIDLDHTQWLGETLPRIAFEKAGIIKPHVPAITAVSQPEAFEVIKRVASERQAPLRVVRPEEAFAPPLTEIELPLPGRHQKQNAAVALAAVEFLQPVLPVAAGAIQAGLENLSWPGRLQLLTTASSQTILLDGAHNPAGAKTLEAAIRDSFPESDPALILGILKDKDLERIGQILCRLSNRIFLVPIQSFRTATPGELEAVCRRANPSARIRACVNLAEALRETASEKFVVITGSLFLVGEALELLGGSNNPGGV
jgi:dihydrofolate synthase / folylpolyglutamate synthase